MAVLYKVPSGGRYRITSIPDAPLLQSLGIFQGGVVTKTSIYALGGPVLLDMDARDVAIGKALALQIEVEEVAQ